MTTIQSLAELIENASDYGWLRHAACGELSLDALDQFFVEAGRSLSRETVQLCSACPVKAECLQHAYDHEIAGGYFGGVSPTKRRALPIDSILAEPT
ncbi:MAG TPA: WhiB family transcriptional regulator [Ilumatobacter sp.]|nr:WhiB family transcriptional regulator [Ilumatobacter sp.]